MWNVTENATLSSLDDGGVIAFTNTTVRNTLSRLERVAVELRDPLSIVVPVTCVYVIIFVTGLIGNVSTCIVIARNKSMHTATNYYLFSLAVSDLLLLVSGLPPEMYRLWWPQTYIFGELFCMVQSFSAETSTNATILTITAFTVERYIAICHPFLTHTMSKLSRAIKFVIAIWLVALCLAVPQAIQYGLWRAVDEAGAPVSRCTMTRVLSGHAFELSTLVFFVTPMTAITVLYVLIAVKLRRSRLLTCTTRPAFNAHSVAATADQVQAGGTNQHRRFVRSPAAQNRVIKMLVAVVVAFFVCWAPFHAQRLLAVYMSSLYTRGGSAQPSETALRAYLILNYISGILYFLSTTINPLLYNIMSNKFREAFKTTLAQLCNRHHSNYGPHHQRTYSTLSRYPTSFRANQRTLTDGGMHGPGTPREHAVIHAAGAPGSGSGAPGAGHQHPATGKLLNNTGSHNHSRRFRPRGNSTSSQVTVLTSLSLSRTDTRSKNDNSSSGDGVHPHVYRQPNTQKRSPLSALAHRFRMCTLFRPGAANIRRRNTVNTDPHHRDIHRHCSVDSGNTISNSSLQDLDETEFSSSDLVKYMEEVNCDLA